MAKSQELPPITSYFLQPPLISCKMCSDKISLKLGMLSSISVNHVRMFHNFIQNYNLQYLSLDLLFIRSKILTNF